jgi:hypothetical protein
MEVTRQVIIDLLPLYIADEVSKDTRALVKEYLAGDPELAELAQDMARAELAGEIPIPLNKEKEMETYLEAKKIMFRRTVVIALTIALGLCAAGGAALVWLVWLAMMRLGG